MTETSSPKPPPRKQVSAIISRYLKETPPWPAAREFPIFYRLWKQYPSEAFWTKYEVGYRLNTLIYFLSAEGKQKLASDWLTFHFNFAPEPDSNLDTSPQIADTGEMTPAPDRQPHKPRTTADFLSNQHG